MIIDNHGYKQYTKEEIIKLAQDWFNKNGHLVQRDLKHANNLPSSCQVKKHFGSLQGLLKEANIKSTTNPKLFNREELSDEEMLNNYRKFVNEHLKTHIYLPTNDEVDACPYVQCTSVYIRRFGSFEKINELIGYNQIEFNNNALEKDMLLKYKKACRDYGHTLTSREITKLSRENKDYIYSTEAYSNHFGTIHNLQEICGLEKTIPGRGADRKELIEKLQWLGSELGRRPIQADLIYYKNIPSANTYVNEFGSFKIALNEAGYKKQKVLKTKNGIKVRSWYELKIAQVLESYNILYKNEIMYKDVIPNFKKKYRFDFRVIYDNKLFYIELFGIQGNDLYEKRKQEKIQLCKKHNIPLIQLYQSDIYSKTNKEIYETIMSYIDGLSREVV